LSKKDYINSLCICLAGRAGEEIFTGCITDGCTGDLSAAENVVRNMTHFGLIGLSKVTFYNDNDTTKMKDNFNDIKSKLWNKYYKKAKRILHKNYYLGRYLIDEALKNKDILTSSQIDTDIEYYNTHKQEIKNKYHHHKLKTVIMN
jgi:ATP-dependent Zn protease